jgi:tRNA-dihydrouridine synthase B
MNIPEIHFAPLQGYTDNAYRMVHQRLMGGADFYYTPYFSVENDGTVKVDDLIDHLSNDTDFLTIPQLLAANVNELKIIASVLKIDRFSTINLNLGCPYPMVTRKGRGAALIQKPDLVASMVRYLKDEVGVKVSLKVRTGMEQHHDIFAFLNNFPLSEVSSIIVHPRVAAQLYKGMADVSVYKLCLQQFPQVDFIYNGDIDGAESFQQKHGDFPNQQKWMIGRGLLRNPALGKEIKSGNFNNSESITERLNFALALIAEIENTSKNKEHALNRVKVQLKMLLDADENTRKKSKKIQKTKSVVEIKDLLIN